MYNILIDYYKLDGYNNMIFIMLFSILNIKYNLKKQNKEYDKNDYIEDIILLRYDHDYEYLNKLNIIKNGFSRKYLLLIKDLYEYNISPYNFQLNFKLKYNKKTVQDYINKYKDHYKENLGNDLWLIKQSSYGDNVIICSTKELLDLENNKILKKYDIYDVIKYVEKPYLYNNKRSDIKVFYVVYCYKKNNKLNYKFYIYNKILLRYEQKNYDNKKINTPNSSYLYKWMDKEKFNDIIEKMKFVILKYKNYYLDNKLENVYEIYEMDFLLDKDYNTYFLNFNPIKYNKYYFDILMDKEKYMFNMYIMIILKVLKVYNKNKKFITEENKDIYKDLCNINKFKNNFELILYIHNDLQNIYN